MPRACLFVEEPLSSPRVQPQRESKPLKLAGCAFAEQVERSDGLVDPLVQSGHDRGGDCSVVQHMQGTGNQERTAADHACQSEREPADIVGRSETKLSPPIDAFGSRVLILLLLHHILIVHPRKKERRTKKARKQTPPAPKQPNGVPRERRPRREAGSGGVRRRVHQHPPRQQPSEEKLLDDGSHDGEALKHEVLNPRAAHMLEIPVVERSGGRRQGTRALPLLMQAHSRPRFCVLGVRYCRQKSLR
mmetsp:Transcript_16811/g.64014  ORF Transcript_16811/g.64014 Transcript_16811/m.64014 type:complete len:247 (-) Transcript_16811:407-1147(-)